MSLEKLFNEWEKAYKKNGIYETFVKDGIVDEHNYKNIVWILKDTNNYEKPINELILKVLKEKNKKSGLWKGITWHNIGRATAKLINFNISFKEAEKNKKEYLSNIAVLNIKKISGGSSINDTTMKKYTNEYADYIIEELKILNPNIVVLGGTYKFLKDILKLKNKEKNIYKSELFPNIRFIKAYHPGARVKKIKYFNQF